MCMVVRMVAVPVPRFLKRCLPRGLIQLLMAGRLGLRSCLLTALVARRARCTSVLSALLAVTELGPRLCRAVDRAVVDARLSWSAGGCFVGRPLRGRGLAGHRGSLKTRLKRRRINETDKCRTPSRYQFQPLARC